MGLDGLLYDASEHDDFEVEGVRGLDQDWWELEVQVHAKCFVEGFKVNFLKVSLWGWQNAEGE